MEQTVKLIGIFAAIVFTSVTAAAQDRASQPYATRPIRMVMPFSAGGGTDIIGASPGPSRLRARRSRSSRGFTRPS